MSKMGTPFSLFVTLSALLEAKDLAPALTAPRPLLAEPRNPSRGLETETPFGFDLQKLYK